MKKLYLFILLLILSVSLSADETFSVSDNNIFIEFNQKNGKHVVLEKFADKKSNTDFIKYTDNTCSLWQFDCKKDGHFSDEAITLTDYDAESFEYNFPAKNKIVLLWKNVKKSEMSEGFDVTAAVTLKNSNSYWDLEISANSEYGLFEVKYPCFDLDAQNGDQYMFPDSATGVLYTEFDNPKGFLYDGTKYSVERGYYCQANLQMNCFTKGNTTLYICPEDVNSYIKTTNIRLGQPNIISYIPRIYVPDSCKAGKSFKMPYSYNLAVVKGDYYNAAKKYRKWGIEHNFGVFQNGKLENRKDLPDWFKLNNMWYMSSYDNRPADSFDSLLDCIDKVGMKGIVHLYGHSQYDYDTHYPNWIPLREDHLKDYRKLQEKGMKIMPYTNGKLVDMNLSPTYKKYGDILLQKNEKGEPYFEGWAADLGAKNAVSCIDSPYADAYLNEVKNIMKIMNFDAYYMDQIGGLHAYPCYNREHTHPMGGGDYVIKDYNKLIGNLRKDLAQIKGETVPLTTECAGEAFVFDGWLREGQLFPEQMAIPINAYIYNDYAVNFGTKNFRMEYETEGEISAFNKTAMTLVKGHQLGWYIGTLWETKSGPKFIEHISKVAKARESHVKYFNYGEMVRPVDIKDNPTKEMEYYVGWNPEDKYIETFPLIKTCSLYWHGKTMICFSSVSDTPLKVEWSQKAEDLNLKNKNAYTITQTYANNKTVNKSFKSLGTKGVVKSTFTIDPFDTVMFIVN